MNKFLLIIVLLILVINLTFQLIDATTTDGTTNFKSFDNGIKRITLKKMKHSCTDVDNKHHCRNQISNSISKKINRKKRIQKAIQVKEIINDEELGTYWMGLVTIGTPGQLFYLNFDTGSSDLWVANTQCEQSCSTNNTFNSSASSTYQFRNSSFYMFYGDGTTVNGTWANDTVTLAGISIQNQTFGVADSVQNTPVATGDGMLGMGYPQLAVGGETPLIWAMYLTGKLKEPVFCFWFDAVSTGNDQGELILGGYDTTKYIGSITYASVTNKGYWQFIADKLFMTIGSTTTIIAYSFNAMLDTGTTAGISGPAVYINEINSILNATYDSSTGWYILNCKTKSLSQFPNITITINGVPFTLTPSMYIRIESILNQYVCYSTIASTDMYDSDGQSVWILGDYFMRRFYSVFDMKNDRIGLALSTTYSATSILLSELFPLTTSTTTKHTISIFSIIILSLILFLF